MRNAKIIASGMYVPDQVIKNDYFDSILGEDVSTWLETNVQIFERRWCKDDQSTADLCIAAANEALTDAGLSPQEIDLLIIATDTPEYVSPSTASKVQYLCNMSNAATFDINTACAGFVTALDVGSKFIQADDQYKNVMIIGAYAMSKYLDIYDKKTATLFADGAGAVILQQCYTADTGFQCSQLKTQGQFYGHMGIYGGATAIPCSETMLKNQNQKLRFVHKFPKELNPQMWSDLANSLCEKAGISPLDIDHYFLTQININSIFETMDLLNVPRERATTIMHHFGYTGSACIPLAFDQVWQAGGIKPGDKAIFIGSGGGLAFAAALFYF
jgi:3-oxoacyl-[acyl-carrier-protein] synthase-3